MTDGDIKQTFGQVRELAKTLTRTPDDERVLVYKSIDPLLLSLEGVLRHARNAYASDKINELKVHLIALARLDESDGYSDEEHYEWALNALQDLHASGAFGEPAGT